MPINQNILVQKFEILTGCKTAFYSNNLYKKIYYESNKKYLKYIFIPQFIILKKTSLFFILKIKNNSFKTQYLTFSKIFKNFLKSTIKSFRKKLILKGLGFKMNSSDDKKYLILKVGLSYTISLEIPKNIRININKKILIIESYDKINLGNFVDIIRKTKSPETYKEKGFWIKNEKRTLKEIKKT